MNWPRILANIGISGLLPAVAMFALMKWATVDRSECNWETFENLCSDYEGVYGIVCAVLLLLWAALTYAFNKSWAEGR